jgi:hypothetical protein
MKVFCISGSNCVVCWSCSNISRHLAIDIFRMNMRRKCESGELRMEVKASRGTIQWESRRSYKEGLDENKWSQTMLSLCLTLRRSYVCMYTAFSIASLMMRQPNSLPRPNTASTWMKLKPRLTSTPTGPTVVHCVNRSVHCNDGVRGRVVGWGTLLQVGWSRFRVPMRSCFF